MVNRIVCGLLVVGVLVWVPVVRGWQSASHVCPYLDSRRPLYSVEFSLIPDARTEETDRRYSQVMLDVEADLAYVHDVLYGDMDLSLRMDSVFPLRDTIDFRPPHHLMELVLDVRWFWRYVNDMALEVKASPGVYSETRDVLDMPLAMPIRVAGVYSLNRDVAGVAGVSVRPSFNRLLMPHAGVVWEPIPEVRVEALVPAGGVTWHVTREWATHIGWEWDSTTYHVKPGAGGRDRLTFESKMYTVGVTHVLHDALRVSGSLGVVMDRQVRSTRSRTRQRETTELDDALVVHVGVAGAF